MTADFDPADAKALANLLLDWADELGLPITPMKLQKLAYYCHAEFLLATGRPLIAQEFEAWEYGPVIPGVFHEFKVCGADPIGFRAQRFDPITARRDELGERKPAETRRFADYPGSGLRQVNQIEWGPDVLIRVKGVCWYVSDGTPVIPILQPRKAALSEESMSLYVWLGRQAFCKDDWYGAKVELVDLSGEDKVAYAKQIFDHELPSLSERQVSLFVNTYLEAKSAVDVIRSSRPKQPPKPKAPDLFDPKPPR